MELILQWIIEYSLKYDVDYRVAVAIAQVESGINPEMRGEAGEVGIFQLMPSTFKQYSIEELKDPKLNIELGIKYLAEMKHKCVHQNNNTWITCYNLGPEKAKKVKHPNLWPYYKKVMYELVQH